MLIHLLTYLPTSDIIRSVKAVYGIQTVTLRFNNKPGQTQPAIVLQSYTSVQL